ncbi:hypothetical protein BDV34DRAFT_191534 [Aspergillus parasiticus]|uniref:Glycosyltransferase family 28 N-terminal domain-containing protein n=1 Tax=Aspergillus parasiticus TaxID=5067 RepID=A0A5N6DRU0_ASPPA|nr:hypothetical protein BDV34DRAFT_191534 [Aspergillus parasiticus]
MNCRQERKLTQSTRERFQSSGYGRLDLNLTEQNLARLFARVQISDYPPSAGVPREKPPAPALEEEGAAPVHLNIVIHVIGSRGDIQPFIVIGKTLKAYGHRVQLATHLAFRDRVKENGLEFFNIGGNPQELMLFMVKMQGCYLNSRPSEAEPSNAIDAAWATLSAAAGDHALRLEVQLRDAKSTVFWTGCHCHQLKHSPTRLPVSDDIAPSQPLRILYPILL